MTADLLLSVGTVARRLDVPPATLRTWSRRYGIGAGARSPGRHRRYSGAEVARLEHMQALIAGGVPAADAARAALSASASLTPVPAQTRPPRGLRLPLAGAGPAARELARAVMAMDEGRASRLVSAALDSAGIVPAWDQVLVPVLRALGQRFERTGRCVAEEHLLTAVVISALSAAASRPRPAAGGRPVLLACAEGERHSMPVHALAAALASLGIRALVLGADVPARALAHAIRRTGPATVFVWSQQQATGDPGRLAALPPGRAALLLLGGPGWRQPLPAPARLVGSLAEAASVAAAAAQG